MALARIDKARWKKLGDVWLCWYPARALQAIAHPRAYHLPGDATDWATNTAGASLVTKYIATLLAISNQKEKHA